MSRLCTALGLAALTVAMATGQWAQAQEEGAAKALGHYNFWQSMGWQHQAQHQARSLYYYGQTKDPSADKAKEHAAAARAAVTLSQKHLAELKKTSPNDKAAQASIAKIEEIHKKVLTHCDACDKAVAKGDHTAMSSASADIVHDLHDADAEMKNLQKTLKLNSEVPKK